MSLDLIALIIFVLGLSFWTGVLHNRVSSLEKRLEKNDLTTDKVPEMVGQMSVLLGTLNEMKNDLHEIKKDMTQMKVDIEGLKKDVCS